jgi:hypothetical protein
MDQQTMRARLMLSGYRDLAAWARDAGYPPGTVRQVVSRWLPRRPGDQDRHRRRMVWVEPSALPAGAEARRILGRLSGTLGEEVLPGVGRFDPQAPRDPDLDAALERLERSAADTGVTRVTDAQIAEWRELAKAIVSASAGTDDAVDIRFVWSNVRARTGVSGYRLVPAQDYERVCQYLEGWLLRAEQKQASAAAS